MGCRLSCTRPRWQVHGSVPSRPLRSTGDTRPDRAPTRQVTAARIVFDRPLTGHMTSDHKGVLAEIAGRTARQLEACSGPVTRRQHAPLPPRIKAYADVSP